MNGVEPRHAGKRDFQGDGDLPFHFFRGRARK